MSEIAFKVVNGVFDFLIESNSLVIDDGLESILVVALFCDARVGQDEIPNGVEFNGGYWADSSLGSKLWLLKREKLTTLTAIRAKQYCHEALKHLIELGVLKGVFVEVEIIDGKGLGISIGVLPPDGGSEQKYYYLWEGQALK